MATIAQTASYVRSKNAGPFWITIDIFCDNDSAFQNISLSKKLNEKTIAEAYQVLESTVKFFSLPDLKVIKISIPRLNPQGSKYERDMHAGQQYIQILDLEL
jgi:hypothetical protein